MKNRDIEHLVKDNIALVDNIVIQFRGNRFDIEERKSEGYLALINAAQSYDDTKGMPFERYAAWKIRQRIKRTDKLRQEEYQRSMDAPLREGTRTTLHDVIPDATIAEQHLPEKGHLANVLAEMHHNGKINQRELIVVKSFYGIGTEKITYKEIGKLMDLKRERVRQILKKTMRKIKNELKIIAPTHHTMQEW